MPGTVTWRQADFERMVAGQIIAALTEIGREAKAFVQRETPYRTGYARRSIYFVVLDEAGNRVAGDTHDENGVPVPANFGGTGRYRVIVGANAPYYIWIEVGTRGRPGHAALARANDLIQARIMLKLAEAKRR
jgi:hypothetical protein